MLCDVEMMNEVVGCCGGWIDRWMDRLLGSRFVESNVGQR